MKFLLLLLICFNGHATEVDNFSNRYVPLKDARVKLNQYMNKKIDLTLIKVNNKKNCEINPDSAEKVFYSKLYKKIGGFLWAKYEQMIQDTNFVEKRSVAKKKSIYKDLNIINAFAMSIAKLGSTINIDNHIVGTDKLGHFISVGWTYMKSVSIKQKNIQKAMSYGAKTEEGFFGKSTTGVYSYGDLAANYDGYFFWKDLIDSTRSPSTNPYLICDEGKLKRVRDFDWSDYITDAWDEGVNCSGFRNSVIESKVEDEIKKLEKNDPKNRYQCPIKNCDKFRDRYPSELVNC
jgi:hypothetical protein